MIIPILPLFLTALGGTGVVIGIVGGLRESIPSILNVFAGHWSDKIGKRKIFVTSGYLSSALFKVLLGISTAWQQTILFASLERVGKGLRTAPRDAIIAESAPSQKGKAFGIHRAFDTSGAILGSLLAFLLIWYLELDMRTIIIIAAAVAFVSLIPLAYVQDTKRKPQHVSLKIGFKKLPTKLKIFIIIAGLFALGNFSYMFFILKAQTLFAGKLALGAPILLYLLFNIVYASCAIPAGSISDRIGRRKVIVTGYFLFALTSLGFALTESLPMFILLFAVYGLSFALIEGNQRALIADLAPKDLEATALGTYHTTVGILALPASIIAGLLWEINPTVTFWYGFAVSITAVILFIAYKRYVERRLLTH